MELTHMHINGMRHPVNTASCRRSKIMYKSSSQPILSNKLFFPENQPKSWRFIVKSKNVEKKILKVKNYSNR